MLAHVAFLSASGNHFMAQFQRSVGLGASKASIDADRLPGLSILQELTITEASSWRASRRSDCWPLQVRGVRSRCHPMPALEKNGSVWSFNPPAVPDADF